MVLIDKLGSAMMIYSNAACDDCGPSDVADTVKMALNPGSLPPFILSNDLSRAVMHIVQSLIGFTLMITVM